MLQSNKKEDLDGGIFVPESDPNLKRKNGLLYLDNVKQIRVNGKDILPDLLRIIKSNPHNPHP